MRLARRRPMGAQKVARDPCALALCLGSDPLAIPRSAHAGGCADTTGELWRARNISGASKMADAAAPAPAEAEPAAPIFKRKTNASNLRKRNRDAPEDGAEETKANEPEQGGADAAPDRPGRPPKKDTTIFSVRSPIPMRTLWAMLTRS